MTLLNTALFLAAMSVPTIVLLASSPTLNAKVGRTLDRIGRALPKR